MTTAILMVIPTGGNGMLAYTNSCVTCCRVRCLRCIVAAISIMCCHRDWTCTLQDKVAVRSYPMMNLPLQAVKSSSSRQPSW